MIASRSLFGPGIETKYFNQFIAEIAVEEVIWGGSNNKKDKGHLAIFPAA